VACAWLRAATSRRLWKLKQRVMRPAAPRRRRRGRRRESAARAGPRGARRRFHGRSWPAAVPFPDSSSILPRRRASPSIWRCRVGRWAGSGWCWCARVRACVGGGGCKRGARWEVCIGGRPGGTGCKDWRGSPHFGKGWLAGALAGPAAAPGHALPAHPARGPAAQPRAPAHARSGPRGRARASARSASRLLAPRLLPAWNGCAALQQA
jgi:hypothetical protein